MAKDPSVITFGCRLNTYESEKIKQTLERHHIDDIIVVNTCAVTAEAERQARQAIRKLKRENPHKKIIVTGCSATIHQSIYEKMPQVDKVVDNTQKNFINNFLPLPQIQTSDFPILTPSSKELLSGFEGKSRAFLQIQTGCNNVCSFCVIRIARGKSVSFSWTEILEQAQKFVDQGYQEINLTGVDITSYENEDRTLGILVQMLLKTLPSHIHIRLSSLDPAAIDESLYEAMADKRLLPHWHLSLQSGDPFVLRRMIRRHSPENILHLSEKVRLIRPELALGADIIVGFPGETEEMFMNTCYLVKQCKISLLHVFPYSDRPGTLATTLTPKIPSPDKRERAKRLREIGNFILQEAMKDKIGQKVKVLIEQKNKEEVFYGKTEHFFPIEVQGKSFELGHFYEVQVAHIQEKNNHLSLSGIPA